MTRVVRATWDASLRATVVERHALLYGEGPDRAEDRPAHVRAGSGAAILEGSLLVVQDDANFLARVNPATWEVEAIALPRGEGGLRLFGDDRGNKRHKLDLEACLALPVAGRSALVAFGSGSTSARERVVVFTPGAPEASRVRVVPVPGLYACFRRAAEFAGSELNVEGVAMIGDRLRFFQRGNGKPLGELVPVNASGELRAADVMALLEGHGGAGLALENVLRYDLGALASVPLSFTDAARGPGGTTLFIAAAEASPDAVRDGEVSGSVLGVIDAEGARWAPLVDGAGALLREKAEGLVWDPATPDRALVVLDADDHARPSEACEVRLEGAFTS